MNTRRFLAGRATTFAGRGHFNRTFAVRQRFMNKTSARMIFTYENKEDEQWVKTLAGTNKRLAKNIAALSDHSINFRLQRTSEGAARYDHQTHTITVRKGQWNELEALLHETEHARQLLRMLEESPEDVVMQVFDNPDFKLALEVGATHAGLDAYPTMTPEQKRMETHRRLKSYEGRSGYGTMARAAKVLATSKYLRKERELAQETGLIPFPTDG